MFYYKFLCIYFLLFFIMKKIWIFSFLCLFLVLGWCEKWNVSIEQLQGQYQQNMHVLFSDLKEYFDWINESVHSDFVLNFDFPESSLEGSGVFESHKDLINGDERSDIMLNAQWIGSDLMPEEWSKSLNVKLETRLVNDEMLFKIDDLDVFLWNWNIQAIFVNDLAQKAEGKWVSLWENGFWPINVFNSPDYLKILTLLEGVFEGDQEQIAEIVWIVSAVFNLWIDMDEFEVDDMWDTSLVVDENGMTKIQMFKAWEKVIPIEMIVNNEWVRWEISVVDLEDEFVDSHYPSISFELKPKKKGNYEISIEKKILHITPKDLPEWRIDWNLKLYKKDGILIWDFEAMMKITSLELAQWEKLNIRINGQESLTKTVLWTGDFAISGKVVDLFTLAI